MADKTLAIKITSTFDAKGATSATAALRALIAAAQKANAAQTQQSTAMSRAAAAAANATTANQRLATEQQRTAQAAARAAAAQAQAEAAQTRAAAAAQRLAAAQERAARSTQQSASATQSWSSQLSGTARNVDQLIGTVTQLGSAFAVIGAASATYELARTSAAAAAAEQSFASLAESAGQSGDALLRALTEASGGAVSQADIIKSANTALLLLGSDAATKLPRLLEIARASATTLGTDVGMVFDSLVTGISRNSIELIDNAGITIKSGEAYAAYAAEIGKSVNALTASERQQAILNAVLAGGEDILQRTAGAGETTLETFQRTEAAVADLTSTMGSLIADALQPAVASFGDAAAAAKNFFDEVEKRRNAPAEALNVESYEEYTAAIRAAAEASKEAGGDAAFFGVDAIVNVTQLSEELYNYAQALMESGMSAEQADAAARAYGAAVSEVSAAQGRLWDDTTLSSGALQQLSSDMDVLTAAGGENASQVGALAAQYNHGQLTAVELYNRVNELAGAYYDNSSAADDNTAATGDNITENEALTSVLDTTALALQDKEAALEAAKIAAYEAAAADGDLHDQARAAAQALYEAGPAGAAAAADLANSSAGVDVLTSAYLRLLNAKNAALGGGGGAAGGAANVGKGRTTAKDLGDRIIANRPPPRPGRGSGGGGGGRGAGASRVNEAERTAERLTEIEQQAAEKIADINERTAERLLEIDQRTAAERARIAQELADTIAASSANQIAEQEANDLEAIGETDEKRLAAIAAREKAEAQARERLNEAAAQAQEELANATTEEEAAAAQAKYEAQQQYISERQRLDEEYAAKQAELANNPEELAALDQQYQEAVTALETARDTELAIEMAKIEAKARLREEEKAKVIADAQTQKDAVVAAAVEQAEKVKGASADATAKIAENLGAQASAAQDWASATEAAAQRVADAYAKAADAAANAPGPPSGGGGASSGSSGGGGATAAAGGGTFVAGKPMKITVGDAPDPELVTVTPLGRKGTTRVGSGWARMGGGGMGVAGMDGGTESLKSTNDTLRQIERAAAAANINTEAISNYAGAVGDALDLLQAVDELARQQEEPAPALSLEAMRRLADEAKQVAQVLKNRLVPTSDKEVEAIGNYTGAVGDAIGMLQDVTDLRRSLGEPTPAISLDYVQALADEAMAVGRIIGGRMARPTEAQLTTLESYLTAVSDSVELLSRMADLRQRLGDPAPPISLAYATALADESQAIGRIIGGRMGRPTEEQLATLHDYVAAVTGSVDLLVGMQDLRERLGEPQPALSLAYVTQLADETQAIGRIIGGRMGRPTEQQLETLRRYVDAVAGSVDLLVNVQDLREELSEPQAPISLAYITALADESRRVTQIVQGRLLPTTEEQATALSRYADTAGAAIGILSDVAGLRADAVDLAPPINAGDMARLADDARRVTEIIRGRLVPTTEDQADEASRYADAAGASLGILRDTLGLTGNLFADYRSPTDAQLNLIATDAQRIVQAFQRGARLLGTDGSEEAAAYGAALANIVGAARESLLTIQAINDQTFALDPAKLAAYEQNAGKMIATVGRLAQQAAAVDPAQLAGLQAVTGAISAQAEALIRLSAVPFDNLGAIAGGFAGSGVSSAGGGATNITIAPGAISIYAQPGMDASSIAQQVLAQLQRQVQGRRFT